MVPSARKLKLNPIIRIQNPKFHFFWFDFFFSRKFCVDLKLEKRGRKRRVTFKHMKEGESNKSDLVYLSQFLRACEYITV